MTAKKKEQDNVPQQKRCFVVGPIGNIGSETRINADWVLDGIIRPTLEAKGYLVERSDCIATPGNIDTQVINAVIDADLVIADLSEHNANAFYELGLRHMSPNKPVIHMIRSGDSIPFDNTAFRTIVFDHSTIVGLEKAKIDLAAQVEETEKEGFVVETPVSRARVVRNIKFQGTDPQKLQQNQIELLEKKINALEENLHSNEILFEKRPKTFADSFRKKEIEKRWQTKKIGDYITYENKVGKIIAFHDGKAVVNFGDGIRFLD